MTDTAKRYNEDKPQLGYLLTFPDAIRSLSRVLQYGASKYALYNYMRGAPTSQYVDCMLRHLTAWHEGEDLDPESGEHHVGHVVFNALQLLQVCLTQPHRDDRPHVVMAEQDVPKGTPQTYTPEDPIESWGDDMEPPKPVPDLFDDSEDKVIYATGVDLHDTPGNPPKHARSIFDEWAYPYYTNGAQLEDAE